MRCTPTIVCRERLAVGFRLAGLEAVGVRKVQDAEDELRRLLKIRRPTLVFVDHDICKGLSPRLRSAIDESQAPRFVRLPLTPGDNATDFTAQARSSVRELVQSALGVGGLLPTQDSTEDKNI